MLTRSDVTSASAADARPPKAASRPQWAFIGEASLPAHPEARRQEKRGRRWLVVSFLLCPCHAPMALALAGALLGGSTFGGAITGNALPVGIVMSALYTLMLWRGFRLIRRAKRVEAAGGSLRCTADGCEALSALR
jgi:hypothetical protein